MEDNTVLACRSAEFCQPQLVDRNTYERWLELGRPDIYTGTRRQVEAILAGSLKNPLPDKTIGRLEGYVPPIVETSGDALVV